MTLNNAIVLSGAAFGSIYLFSTFLKEINKFWLKDKKTHYSFYIINGFVFAGSTFMYGFLVYQNYIKLY
jgi:hypothetical protein